MVKDRTRLSLGVQVVDKNRLAEYSCRTTHGGMSERTGAASCPFLNDQSFVMSSLTWVLMTLRSERLSDPIALVV
jgi:hypothetical protein